MPFLLFFNLGATEIIVICAVILLLFGGKKIPELMRGIGKGIREFNSARSNLKAEIDEGISEDSKPSPPPADSDSDSGKDPQEGSEEKKGE